MDKVELLTRVLQAKDRGLTMIFARTKRTVQRVADDLAERGFAAAAVHGDLGQGAREQALRAFRSGKVDVLVATDVAARGIDVTDVTHVVNYQCPEDAKTYVHRIGRTGRAGKTGVAVTLVDWDELHRWKTISDDLGLDMPEAAGDLLHLGAPLHGPRHPRDRDRTPAAGQAHPRRPGRRVRRHRGRPRRTSPQVARDRNGAAQADEARPPRQRRSRARSRAGVLLGSDGAPVDAALTGVESSDATPEQAPAEGTGPIDDAGETTPRRRRRRGGTRRRRVAGDAAPSCAVRRRDPGRRGELRPVRWISGSGTRTGLCSG